MNKLQHPNLLSYKMAFLAGNELWIIFDIMEIGSISSILNSIASEGFKDMNLIATILKETLKGIDYLHQNKQIHRLIYNIIYI